MKKYVLLKDCGDEGDYAIWDKYGTKNVSSFRDTIESLDYKFHNGTAFDDSSAFQEYFWESKYNIQVLCEFTTIGEIKEKYPEEFI